MVVLHHDPTPSVPSLSELIQSIERRHGHRLGHGHHATMSSICSHCYKFECGWITLDNVTGLPNPPILHPNPELAGIGVILGFSLTSYLTLFLLILHYVTVHDAQKMSSRGKEYTNPIDRDLLRFLRSFIHWKPSRRFEYAMEKSVLILSDLQLVTGLGILISGYSQLDCGISAYHWQIMVYVAWFSSFTFLSAMTFLEGYFQANNSLRIIRVCFMVVLSTLLIVALLPTGSHNWLDLLSSIEGQGGGFYPGLAAECYFKQLGLPMFSHGGPKIWSMVISVVVVGVSYLHSGIRLFDPTAELTRKHIRAWPGRYIKRFISDLERRAQQQGIRAGLWQVPFLLAFAIFVSCRVLFDLIESMLIEIVWLSFAIAWGTIKLYDTRNTAAYNNQGEKVDNANPEISSENSWSFGQTLPLILLLLPILSMAQTYLDNDAKAQDEMHQAALTGKLAKNERSNTTPPPTRMSSVQMGEDGTEDDITIDPRNSTSCSIIRCNHHPSLRASRSCSVHEERAPPLPARSPRRPSFPFSEKKSLPRLPTFPYDSFSAYPWYQDHIILQFLQILLVVAFALALLNVFSNFLGLSYFIRNRLFFIWILAILPLASLLHLAIWYLAAWGVRAAGLQNWMTEVPMATEGRELSRWERCTTGRCVYWILRAILIGGMLNFTFWVSTELAGSDSVLKYL